MSGGSAHAEREEFLRNLASLVGCPCGIGGCFPDGSRPDVLRIGVKRRLLFLGDAKDSETPGCAATSDRLRGYMGWLRAHVRRGGVGIFAVCFGRRADAQGWLRTVSRLADLTGVTIAAADVANFSSGPMVAWLIASSTDGHKAQGDRGRRRHRTG